MIVNSAGDRALMFYAPAATVANRTHSSPEQASQQYQTRHHPGFESAAMHSPERGTSRYAGF
jgi:hypothetical protein